MALGNLAITWATLTEQIDWLAALPAETQTEPQKRRALAIGSYLGFGALEPFAPSDFPNGSSAVTHTSEVRPARVGLHRSCGRSHD